MKACRSRGGELAGFLLSLLPGWGRARRSDRVVWSLREVSPVTVTVCSCRDISTHPRAVIPLWFHPSFLRRHQTCLPSLKRQTACEHQAVRHKLAANKCRLAVQMTQEPAHLAETSSLPNSHSSLKDEGGPLKKKRKVPRIHGALSNPRRDPRACGLGHGTCKDVTSCPQPPDKRQASTSGSNVSVLTRSQLVQSTQSGVSPVR